MFVLFPTWRTPVFYDVHTIGLVSSASEHHVSFRGDRTQSRDYARKTACCNLLYCVTMRALVILCDGDASIVGWPSL
jgi:hypothetical protein